MSPVELVLGWVMRQRLLMHGRETDHDTSLAGEGRQWEPRDEDRRSLGLCCLEHALAMISRTQHSPQ